MKGGENDQFLKKILFGLMKLQGQIVIFYQNSFSHSLQINRTGKNWEKCFDIFNDKIFISILTN